MRVIYDISLPVSERLVVWPGDPNVRIATCSHLDNGDSCTTSILSLGTHTGTHIDAPAHFIPGGHSIDAIDLDILVGPAIVVETRDAASLSAAVLESLSIPDGHDRIIFHTRNSRHWENDPTAFKTDYVAIPEEGAMWLADHGFRLIGIDALSVAPFRDERPTHQILLSAGIVIVEGLNLHGIRAGTYEIVCLPLKLIDTEGAPARVILIGDSVSAQRTKV